jgi:hypothetical protein
MARVSSNRVICARFVQEKLSNVLNNNKSGGTSGIGAGILVTNNNFKNFGTATSTIYPFERIIQKKYNSSILGTLINSRQVGMKFQQNLICFKILIA